MSNIIINLMDMLILYCFFGKHSVQPLLMSYSFYLDSVSKHFFQKEEKITILDNISIHLPECRSLSITGESGSGKSTLLSILGGLDHSSEGKVYYHDLLISQLNEVALTQYRKNYINFLFQHHFLLKDFTIWDNVSLVGLIEHYPYAEAKDKAIYYLKKVNLCHRLKHYPHEISGGESQRVALARALMGNGKIILADEPTGSLDEYNSQLVQDLLFQSVEEEKKLLILVTHSKILSQKTQYQYLLHTHKLEKIC